MLKKQKLLLRWHVLEKEHAAELTRLAEQPPPLPFSAAF
jgi:hypothetical protein